MGVKVTFNDNSGRLLAQMQGNKIRALTAMGLSAVQFTVERMEGGYGKPIRDTGSLMRDVASEVENSAPDTVDVGNSHRFTPERGNIYTAEEPRSALGMKIGTACAIFLQINSEKYTDEEKGTAILEVLKMPTHNEISKSAMLEVIGYLLNLAFDVPKESVTAEEW